MIWTYILPPLVGGVIGYVTNDIAIRMLFRPHSAKHIMGWRVPFTPGIIPKETGRIVAPGHGHKQQEKRALSLRCIHLALL